jgi:ribosomal protein S18 acetylase RimI-like enzyme
VEHDGEEPIGIVTWFVTAAVGVDEAAGQADGEASQEAEGEVRALVVAESARGQGAGRMLIEAAAVALRQAGVRRAWLVTTNDNLAALALYQKAGWRLTALRPGALEGARRRLKPGIPVIGGHGIPLLDELELELGGFEAGG